MARVSGGERIDGFVAGDLDTRLVDEVDVAVIATDRRGGAALEPGRRGDLWLARSRGGQPHSAGAGDRPARMRGSPSR